MEITAGRRMTPGCESRWLGMARSVAGRRLGIDGELPVAKERSEPDAGVVMHGLHGAFNRLDDHRVGMVGVVAPAGNVELEDLRRHGVSIRVERGGQGGYPRQEGAAGARRLRRVSGDA